MRIINPKHISKRSWVHITLIILFAILFISGVNIHLIVRRSFEGLIWGLDFKDWIFLHIIFSGLLLISVLIHTYQHRAWYKGLFKRNEDAGRRKSKLTVVLTILFLLTIITGFVAWICNLSGHILGFISVKLEQITLLCVIAHVYQRFPHVIETSDKEK